MIASTAKKYLEFLNKTISTFTCKLFVVFIFKLRIGLLLFFCGCGLHSSFLFTHGQLFSLNARLSLLSIKLCSALKFVILYNISITQYPWIHQIRIVTHVSVSNIVGQTNAKVSIAW